MPFTPRRDYFHVGFEREIGQLEAYLIVALAGRAMGHGIGADLLRNLDLLFGNERPGDRGAEEDIGLRKAVGAEHRKHVVAHEFFAQILDENVLALDAKRQRFPPAPARVPRLGRDRR